MCSDRTNWYIYFGYGYWDGNCIAYTEWVVDSGPGSPSDLVLSSWEIAALQVVASCGGRGSQLVLRVFLNREDFVYVIKPLCYNVQIYECIPGMYVIVSYSSLKCLLCISAMLECVEIFGKTCELSLVDSSERSGSVRKDT